MTNVFLLVFGLLGWVLLLLHFLLTKADLFFTAASIELTPTTALVLSANRTISTEERRYLSDLLGNFIRAEHPKILVLDGGLILSKVELAK